MKVQPDVLVEDSSAISYSLLPPSEFEGDFLTAVHLFCLFVSHLRFLFISLFSETKIKQMESSGSVTIAGKEWKEALLADFQV